MNDVKTWADMDASPLLQLRYISGMDNLNFIAIRISKSSK